MYYTLSEIITICKQNMGLRDLPKPVTDQDIKWRLLHSALKEFSQRYPARQTFIIGDAERVCNPNPYVGTPTTKINSQSNVYRIPRTYYQNRTIFSVTNVDVNRPNGYNDLYVPQSMFGDPAAIMTGMASLQLVGAMARQMTHALTWEFQPPDILILYNGWANGNYQVEITTSHDESLSTIPPDVFSTFMELCEYDLEEYIYMKLKRIQNLDLGIGSIELKIDDWADAGNKKRELLKNLDEACELDLERIQYW